MKKYQEMIIDLQTEVNYTNSKRKTNKLNKQILKLAETHNSLNPFEQYIILNGAVCGTIVITTI